MTLQSLSCLFHTGFRSRHSQPVSENYRDCRRRRHSGDSAEDDELPEAAVHHDYGKSVGFVCGRHPSVTGSCGITAVCSPSGRACEVPDWGASGRGGEVQWEVRAARHLSRYGAVIGGAPWPCLQTVSLFADLFCHSHPAKTASSLTTSSTSCRSPATWQTSSPSPRRLRWLNHCRIKVLFVI